MSLSIEYLSQSISICIAFVDSLVCVTRINRSPKRCAANLPIPFFPAFVRLKRIDVGLWSLSVDEILINPLINCCFVMPSPLSDMINEPPWVNALIKSTSTTVASASYEFLIRDIQ